jgi:alkylhydroperoxidase family enzyme
MVAAVLRDWRTAPVDEKFRAVLAFLEKLTLTPEHVGPDDIVPMLSVGLNDRAIEEAIYVCFLYNLMDRLADAFDFHIPSPDGFKRHALLLRALGYGMASIPG